MNILPKKRWHVRTKRNIERVRRDEAEALEKELREKERVQTAEREARIEYLKNKKLTSGSEDPLSAEDLANDFLGSLEKCLDGVNKEHEAEKKAEQEKFEKNIGLLTYLGQSSDKKKPWYLEAHADRTYENDERKSAADDALKCRLDPLNDVKKYLSGKNKSSEKKHGQKRKRKVVEERNVSASKQSSKSVEQMRAERLERERSERERTMKLLMKHNLSSAN